jgi:hypothetical protein
MASSITPQVAADASTVGETTVLATQRIAGIDAASPVAFMAQPLVLAAMLARGVVDIGPPDTTSLSDPR